MNKQPDWHSWRELLGTIISNATEKERLANALGVRTITFTRWAGGESVPRLQNLQQLLNALPQYREVLYELILEEFPAFTAASKDVVTHTSWEIPLEFYVFRQTLIERYAELLGVAFASEELYDPGDIELFVIPAAPVQQTYRSRLREHVSALRQGSMVKKSP